MALAIDCQLNRLKREMFFVSYYFVFSWIMSNFAGD